MQDLPLKVGTELRTKIDGLISEAGVDKVRFKEFLCKIKKIGKQFGNPSLSTMTVANAESMIKNWDKTMGAFSSWIDKQS